MDHFNKTITLLTNAGFCDWDIPNAKGYFSPSFKNILGYQADQQIDPEMLYKYIIYPDDLEKLNKNYHSHIAQKGINPIYQEFRFLKPDDNIVWLSVTANVIEWSDDNTPVRLVASIVEIGNQKQTAGKLVKTETLFNMVSSMARVGAWEIDLRTNKINWTKVTREIHGVDDGYESGVDPLTAEKSDFIKDDINKLKVSAAVKKAINERVPVDYEYEIYTAQGENKWIRSIINAEFEGDVCIKLFGTCQDIDRQKRTQIELELSEKQFRSIFEHSAIGMAVVGLDGQWINVNRELCRVLGYTKAELLTKTFNEVTHPDDCVTSLGLIDKFLTHEVDRFSLEKRYIHKDGKTIWVWLTISLIKDLSDKPMHFVSQLKDITDRKNTEIELKKALTELSAIFHSTEQVAIINCDLNVYVKTFNRGAELMLGYSADELIDKEHAYIFHDPEEVQKRIEIRSAQLGRTVSVIDVFLDPPIVNGFELNEWTYRRKDGSTFPVKLIVTAVYNDENEVTGYLGVATDISDLKKVEKALRDSEQRWQFAIEGTGDGLWDLNIPMNKSFHSEQYCSMLGFDSDDFAKTRFDYESRIHPDDREQHDKDLQVYLDGKRKDVYVNQHRVMCKDGSYKWILDRGKVIEWSANGKPLRMIGTHSDITDQKNREQQLRRSFDIISEQNNRLLNFAHIVSHNLRSHSGNFQMLMEMVFDPSTTDEEKADLLHHLKNVSAKLSETIANLNDVITIQTNINLQKVNLRLNDYILKTLDILSGDIKKYNIVIKNEVPTDCYLMYNPAYLESILLNFFTNSIKYRSDERQPQIKVKCFKEQGHDVLIFEDNGIGIDLKMHGENIFGMYKTFHGNKDAKGIGLFITKNQIEALGGKIQVKSKLNKGTTFKVYLS